MCNAVRTMVRAFTLICLCIVHYLVWHISTCSISGVYKFGVCRGEAGRNVNLFSDSDLSLAAVSQFHSLRSIKRHAHFLAWFQFSLSFFFVLDLSLPNSILPGTHLACHISCMERSSARNNRKMMIAARS